MFHLHSVLKTFSHICHIKLTKIGKDCPFYTHSGSWWPLVDASIEAKLSRWLSGRFNHNSHLSHSSGIDDHLTRCQLTSNSHVLKWIICISWVNSFMTRNGVTESLVMYYRAGKYRIWWWCPLRLLWCEGIRCSLKTINFYYCFPSVSKCLFFQPLFCFPATVYF